MKRTISKTSPVGGNRGCLCANGKYSKICCDGSLQAQGVGAMIGGHNSEISQIHKSFNNDFNNNFAI
tara:strand:- start:316 stop:516 length:201 start_codon:yes stop_codon:yes gene_type:complete